MTTTLLLNVKGTTHITGTLCWGSHTLSQNEFPFTLLLSDFLLWSQLLFLYLRCKISMMSTTSGRGTHTPIAFQGRSHNGLGRLFSRLLPNSLRSRFDVLSLYSRSLRIEPGIKVFLTWNLSEFKSELHLESRWWTGFHGGSQDPTSPTASILKKKLKSQYRAQVRSGFLSVINA